MFDARLDEARRVEPVRGFGGHVGFIKRSTGPGWALVGDAGYFKDPLTAHGITDALRDAELLARAIMQGTTAAFDGLRDDAARSLAPVVRHHRRRLRRLPGPTNEVQSLHRAFSAEMSREVRALAALEPLTCRLPSGQRASRQPDAHRANTSARYAELSGDYNPLHFDEAIRRAYEDSAVSSCRVVSPRVSSMRWLRWTCRDPARVFLSQNWKFTAPVYIGDTISGRSRGPVRASVRNR